MIYDISVAKKGCVDSSCITWELVRSKSKTSVLADDIVGLPIKYGKKIANMEIRQPIKSISTGEFVISATFAIEGSNNYFKLID